MMLASSRLMSECPSPRPSRRPTHQWTAALTLQRATPRRAVARATARRAWFVATESMTAALPREPAFRGGLHPALPPAARSYSSAVATGRSKRWAAATLVAMRQLRCPSMAAGAWAGATLAASAGAEGAPPTVVARDCNAAQVAIRARFRGCASRRDLRRSAQRPDMLASPRASACTPLAPQPCARTAA
jgi:hypothetical protein